MTVMMMSGHDTGNGGDAHQEARNEKTLNWLQERTGGGSGS